MVVSGTGKCLGWQYQVLLLIFKQEWFHSDVKGSNGSFWNWQLSVWAGNIKCCCLF